MIFRFFCVIFNVAFVAIRGEDQITDTNLDILFILDQEPAKTIIKGEEIDNTCERYFSSPARFKWCYHTNVYTFNEYARYKIAYDGVNSWMGSILDIADADNIRFAVVHSCSQTLGGVMKKFDKKLANEKLLALMNSGKGGINPGCKKNMAWTMNLAINDVFKNDAGHRLNATAIVIVVSDCLTTEESIVGYTDTMQEFFKKIKGKIYYVCYDYKPPAQQKFYVRLQGFKRLVLPYLQTNNQSDLSTIYVSSDSVEVGRRLDQLMPKISGARNVDCYMVANCSTNCTRDIGGSVCRKNCAWDVKKWPYGTGKPCVKKDDIFQVDCECPPTTQSPMEGSKVMPIVLGTVCAVLAIAAICTIVVCVVFSKRKKKRTKDRAVVVRVKKAPEKRAEIFADLSMAQSTRSTFGTGSKVKSTSKKGSVRKSVKSISKQVGSTRSMASKSAVKNDGKSASKSRLSKV